jgi:TonB family protein
MNGKNLFAKLDGTPAQILIVLGLALALFVPMWRQYEEVGVSKAKARLDQAGQMVALEVEKFKKDQSADLKRLYESTTLTPEERLKKAEELRKAAQAKQEELERTYDDTQLKRAWLLAQAKVVDTRWHDLLGWLGRLILVLGLLTLTIQSEGLKQKTLLIVLLVIMLGSLVSVGYDLRNAYPEPTFEGVQSSGFGAVNQAPNSNEVAREIEKLFENLPAPPPPPAAPMIRLVPEGGIPGGVPGGIPGGVIGGILGSAPSKTTPAPPPPSKIEHRESTPRIRVGSGVQQAKLISRTIPVYPPLAKAARIQGTVILEVVISKQGSVQNLTVLSGHPLLTTAAIDAVKQWRYQTTLLNGEPVEVVTTVTVNFNLAGD